jgi:hypothetical protein
VAAAVGLAKPGDVWLSPGTADLTVQAPVLQVDYTIALPQAAAPATDDDETPPGDEPAVAPALPFMSILNQQLAMAGSPSQVTGATGTVEAGEKAVDLNERFPAPIPGLRENDVVVQNASMFLPPTGISSGLAHGIKTWDVQFNVTINTRFDVFSPKYTLGVFLAVTDLLGVPSSHMVVETVVPAEPGPNIDAIPLDDPVGGGELADSAVEGEDEGEMTASGATPGAANQDDPIPAVDSEEGLLQQDAQAAPTGAEADTGGATNPANPRECVNECTAVKMAVRPRSSDLTTSVRLWTQIQEALSKLDTNGTFTTEFERLLAERGVPALCTCAIDFVPEIVNASHVTPMINRPDTMTLNEMGSLVDEIKEQYLAEPGAEAMEANLLMTDMMAATTEVNSRVMRAEADMAKAKKKADDLLLISMRRQSMKSELEEFLSDLDAETQVKKAKHREDMLGLENVVESLQSDMDAAQKLAQAIGEFATEADAMGASDESLAFLFRIQRISDRVGFSDGRSARKGSAFAEINTVLEGLVQHVQSALALENKRRTQMQDDHAKQLELMDKRRQDRVAALIDAENKADEVQSSLDEAKQELVVAQEEYDSAISAQMRLKHEEEELEMMHNRRVGQIHKTMGLLGDVGDKVKLLTMVPGGAAVGSE